MLMRHNSSVSSINNSMSIITLPCSVIEPSFSTLMSVPRYDSYGCTSTKPQLALIHKEAVWPKRGTIGAAGLDLYAVADVTIPASNDPRPGVSNYVCVDTGVSIIIPEGMYGRVAPRSGLAVGNAIDVLAGVIDSDYRGQIRVALINHSKEAVTICKERAIAQLIFERIYDGDYVKLSPEQYLKLNTSRGTSGFGSTDRIPAVDAWNQFFQRNNPIPGNIPPSITIELVDEQEETNKLRKLEEGRTNNKEGFCNDGCNLPDNFCECGRSEMQSPMRSRSMNSLNRDLPRPVSRRGHIAIDVAESCLKDT